MNKLSLECSELEKTVNAFWNEISKKSSKALYKPQERKDSLFSKFANRNLIEIISGDTVKFNLGEIELEYVMIADNEIYCLVSKPYETMNGCYYRFIFKKHYRISLIREDVSKFTKFLIQIQNVGNKLEICYGLNTKSAR